MKQKELDIILEKHKQWLEDNNTGECANLRYANLRYADLSYADLRSADLRSADLLTFQFSRDSAFYQFDGKIRIGCEYFDVDYWIKNFKDVGNKHSYSELEIEVYGNFINQCKLLEDKREKK